MTDFVWKNIVFDPLHCGVPSNVSEKAEEVRDCGRASYEKNQQGYLDDSGWWTNASAIFGVQ